MASSRANDHNTLSFDTRELDWAEQYKLLSSTVIPRPIALVSTDGPAGLNAAPFSAFNYISIDPPMLMFSVGPAQAEKKGEEKDTLVNVRATGEFVVNVVDEANIEKMNQCVPEYAAGINEIELAGFNTAPSKHIKPPRITDVPVQFECRLVQILEFGNTPYYVVVGEVVQFHCRNDVIDERKYVDMERLNLVGRLVGPGRYSRINDNFEVLPPKLSE